MRSERPRVTGSDRDGNLSPAQISGVMALVGSGSVKEAARAARVDERTVRRWLDRPAFRAEYRAAAREAAADGVSALLAAQRHAVAALVSGLDAESPATRVRAARALLEIGRHALDDDADERLTLLEEEVAAWHARTGSSVT